MRYRVRPVWRFQNIQSIGGNANLSLSSKGHAIFTTQGLRGKTALSLKSRGRTIFDLPPAPPDAIIVEPHGEEVIIRSREVVPRQPRSLEIVIILWGDTETTGYETSDT